MTKRLVRIRFAFVMVNEATDEEVRSMCKDLEEFITTHLSPTVSVVESETDATIIGAA